MRSAGFGFDLAGFVHFPDGAGPEFGAGGVVALLELLARHDE